MVENQEKHTISVLVENKFGVLARVAGLFSGRGYNISSLTVHETEDPAYSKMTIVTTGDAAILEQIDKQLRKLVDVIRVDDLTGSRFIEREMALIKLKTASREEQSQLIQLVEIFDGTIVSVRPSGTEPKIKFYFGVKAPLASVDDYEKVLAELDAKIEAIKKDLKLE